MRLREKGSTAVTRWAARASGRCRLCDAAGHSMRADSCNETTQNSLGKGDRKWFL